MRKLGLDIGDKRIGLALSDLTCLIATPFDTYTRDGNDLAFFKNLVKEKQIDEIVIGLPINMNGTSGQRVEIIKEYGEMLSSNMKEIKISYIDERLTTVQAERFLIFSEMRRDRRKQVIDKVAASLILQAYLDKLNNLKNKI